MEKERKSSAVIVSDVGAWAMNIISSVGIIMANKQLMSSSGFAFAFGQFFFFFNINLLAFSFLFSNISLHMTRSAC
jgi:hypothetical protein